MNLALSAGAAGMAAQQAALDSIAGNLANLDTPGFRAVRPEFASLVSPDGGTLASEERAARTLFTQGRLDETSNEHDFAIDGDGMFCVIGAAGKTAYTRAGNFSPDATGRLALPSGAQMQAVRLPPATTSIDLSPDGTIRAHVANRATPVVAGHIKLFAFENMTALHLGEDGLFYASSACGNRSSAAPGSGGFGRLKQRCLERANVSVVAAMMSVLAAQREYEANAKTVQAADEMLRLANNLERG